MPIFLDLSVCLLLLLLKRPVKRGGRHAYISTSTTPSSINIYLLNIYNKYPLEELIIHARVQKDYYKNTPRLETFGEALEQAKSPVCYNGDIVTAEDCTRLKEMFPTLDCIMTGRGTLKNPALAREIRGGAPASKEEIRRFHDINAS